MTEKDRLLVKLLEKSVDLETMRNVTGFSNYQLSLALTDLKMRGYLIEKKCYENGIQWSLMNNLSEAKVVPIITNSNDFRFIVVADTHLGSTFDSISKLNLVYEYALKNNIHVVVHLGDLIEGVKYPQVQRFPTLDEQLEYAVENYPYDDNIYNIVLLGNHDEHSIKESGFDVRNYLFNNRLDFVFSGYRMGQIKIYDKRISLVHKHDYRPSKTSYEKFKLLLVGHHHYSKIENINNLWTVLVTSLSDDPRIAYAGAMDITIIDSFDSLLFRPLIVDKSVIPSPEVSVKTKGSIK